MATIYDKYKVLLIDDEQDIVDILDTVLRREGFNNLFVANTGTDGINLFKQINPDIIILDIMLPDLSGYDVFNEIRRISQVPILFLSAKGDEMDRLLGFAMGADDYITKPFSPKEVAFRLKARLKVFEPLTPAPITLPLSPITFGDVQINAETGEVYKNGIPLEFTAKELKLLLYLVNHPNHIVSKERICHEVWGEDFFGYDNTITVHIRKIRMKIEDNPSKPQYITTVIGLGYKFIPKEASH